MGHLVTEGDQVGQSGPAFPTAVLTGPDPPVVMHVLHDDAVDELCHDFPLH